MCGAVRTVRNWNNPPKGKGIWAAKTIYLSLPSDSGWGGRSTCHKELKTPWSTVLKEPIAYWQNRMCASWVNNLLPQIFFSSVKVSGEGDTVNLVYRIEPARQLSWSFSAPSSGNHSSQIAPPTIPLKRLFLIQRLGPNIEHLAI